MQHTHREKNAHTDTPYTTDFIKQSVNWILNYHCLPIMKKHTHIYRYVHIKIFYLCFIGFSFLRKWACHISTATLWAQTPCHHHHLTSKQVCLYFWTSKKTCFAASFQLSSQSAFLFLSTLLFPLPASVSKLSAIHILRKSAFQATVQQRLKRAEQRDVFYSSPSSHSWQSENSKQSLYHKASTNKAYFLSVYQLKTRVPKGEFLDLDPFIHSISFLMQL